MADRRAKEVSDEPASGGEVARLHGYREPSAVELDRATEANLSTQIQRGNIARDELLRTISAGVLRQLRQRNLTPLERQPVERAVERLIADRLVSVAANALGVAAFASSFVDTLRAALIDLLKAIDAHLELDVEQWLDELGDLNGLDTEIAELLSDSSDLWRDFEQREAAVKVLAQAHLRLAKPFALRVMSQSFEFDDLMNEAFLILRRIAETFDATQGSRFSSYAKKALQHELKRRVPSRIGLRRHTNAQLRKFDDAQQTLAQQQGSNPSLEDIYELLACNERMRTAIENARRALSLHRQPQRNDEPFLFDPLDELALDPAIDAADREELSRLYAALDTLEAFEKVVVIGKCKLGLSFRAMAKQHRRSPHTLRLLFEAALLKLKKHLTTKSTRHTSR